MSTKIIKVFGMTQDGLIGLFELPDLKGKDGIDGKDGKDGRDGVDGKDGADGKDGRDGIDGKDGKDGQDAKPDGPAEPGPGQPVFASAGKTGAIIKIGGGDWLVQSPDKDYSVQRATNLVGELLRMEIRQGESWKSDANNLSNGVPRERAEVYRHKFPTPYRTDIWISFDLMIEPGGDIVYTNKDWFTYLFQWHHAEQQIKTKTGPSFGMTLSGQGTLKLLTCGDARVPLPASAARTERASVDIKRGELVNVTFRVKHDPVNGEIDWYVGGQLVYSGKKIPIGYTEDQAGYPKNGIYRSTNTEDLVVYFYNQQVLINEPLLERTRQKPVIR